MTIINVYVENDLAGTFKIKENPREYWAGLIDAMSKNPTIIDISGLNPMPVVGMEYLDGTFSNKNNPNLTFIPNNIQNNQRVFAFILNNTFVASQYLFEDTMPQYIAAYLSNPTFEILEDTNNG